MLSKQLKVDMDDAIEQRDATRVELTKLKAELKKVESTEAKLRETERKLHDAVNERDEIKAKLKTQILSQRTLKSIVMDERESSLVKSEQKIEYLQKELSNLEDQWQAKVAKLQQQNQEHTHIIATLTDEVKES